jgi:hypothetical protein
MRGNGNKWIRRLVIGASASTAALMGSGMARLPVRAATSPPAAAIRPSATMLVPGVAATTAVCTNPPNVTGLTFVLNQMDTGQKIGLPEVYGLFVSVVNAVLPNPQTAPSLAAISQTVNQLLALPGPAIAQMPSYGTQFLATLKQAAAPLAAFNGPANQVIDAVVAVMKNSATLLAPALQPFDTTITELASLVAESEASVC